LNVTQKESGHLAEACPRLAGILTLLAKLVEAEIDEVIGVEGPISLFPKSAGFEMEACGTDREADRR
jgi:hypothetical protein